MAFGRRRRHRSAKRRRTYSEIHYGIVRSVIRKLNLRKTCKNGSFYRFPAVFFVRGFFTAAFSVFVSAFSSAAGSVAAVLFLLTADLALAGAFVSAADLADAAFFVLVLLLGSSASAADLEALLVFFAEAVFLGFCSAFGSEAG